MPNGFSMMTRRQLPFFLLGKPGVAELLDDRAEQAGGDRQIEQHVALRAVVPAPTLSSCFLQLLIGVGWVRSPPR